MMKRIKLGLQGGGAFGAFTWGVLDALLADERLVIEAISGASAGAMNAAVLAEGLSEGGREGARKALRRFWEGIAEAGARQAGFQGLFGMFSPAWADAAAATSAVWRDLLSRVASPYATNPLNINPVTDVLAGLVDFEKVRACKEVRLFIAATNVRSGRVRIFENAELTVDHVMASAALPLVFQAVEIGGEAYWDGGYLGNPALFPLFGVGQSNDIVIVETHPITRPDAPRAAGDIIGRLNEITFNASLIGELRAIEFVSRLLDERRIEASRYHKMLIHIVEDEHAMRAFPPADVMNADLALFTRLHEIGRGAASRWLKRSFDDLGERSSVDLRKIVHG